MAGARILIVETEPKTRRLLTRILSQEGFDVRSAPGGEPAIALLVHWAPDVLVLDVDPPTPDGLDLCGDLRRWSCAPIIALSSDGDELQKVRALDLGADDYLTRPFGSEELGARIRVALRHSVGARVRPEILLGDGALRVDFQQRRVWRDEAEVHLTPREYDLLKYLVQHRDTDLRSWEVARGVWGRRPGGECQYLQRYVPRLRRKIEPDPEHPRYLLSYRGAGLRLRSEG